MGSQDHRASDYFPCMFELWALPVVLWLLSVVLLFGVLAPRGIPAGGKFLSCCCYAR